MKLGDGSWSDWKGSHAREVAESGFVTLSKIRRDGYKFSEREKGAEQGRPSCSDATSAQSSRDHQVHLPQDLGVNESSSPHEPALSARILEQPFAYDLEDSSSTSQVLKEWDFKHPAVIEDPRLIGSNNILVCLNQVDQQFPSAAQPLGGDQYATSSNLALSSQSESDYDVYQSSSLNFYTNSGPTTVSENSGHQNNDYQLASQAAFEGMYLANPLAEPHPLTSHGETGYPSNTNGFEGTSTFSHLVGPAGYISPNDLPVSGESSSSVSAWPAATNGLLELDSNFDMDMDVDFDFSGLAEPVNEEFGGF